jgi:hypothetical protein
MRADAFNSGLSGEGEGRGAPGRRWAGTAREGDWGRPKVGDDPDGWVLPVSERERERIGGPPKLRRRRESGPRKAHGPVEEIRS